MRNFTAILSILVTLWAMRAPAQEPAKTTAPKPEKQRNDDKKPLRDGKATKVGVIDIGRVFSKYEKVKIFREQFEKDLKPFKDEEERLKKIGSEWEAALKGDKLKAEDRKKGEKTVIEVRRQLEDLQRDYKEKVAKRTEDQLVMLYREVNNVVRKYAQAHGFSLVLSYGDPVEDKNQFSFTNITRKMKTMDEGGVVLMYFADSLDITSEVLELLNRNITVREGQAPDRSVSRNASGAQ